MGVSRESNDSSHSSSANNNNDDDDDDDRKDKDTTKYARVPLKRALLCVVLVSVPGFLLGQRFSYARADAAASSSPIPSKINNEALSAAAPSAPTNETAFLQRYLREHEEKAHSLPAFPKKAATAGEWADTTARAIDHRKQFAEFIVHPLLLVSGTKSGGSHDEPPSTVAIAVRIDSDADAGSTNTDSETETNSIELARDLLREIVLYKDIEKIMVLLVSSEAEYESKKGEGCPSELEPKNLDIEMPLTDDISINCLHINPLWGHQREGHIEKNLLPTDGFDVSIVLSGCHAKDLQDRLWEKELYDSTGSMVSTCTGPWRLRGRSLTSIGHKEQHLRLDTIETLFNIEEENNSYNQIVDYDVQGINLAVAFHKNTDGGIYKWHLNAANYNTELLFRLRHGSRKSLRYFDGPDFIPFQFPSKHSANSYCAYLEDTLKDSEDLEDERYWCNYGVDHDSMNIPIDQIYVGQSTSGEYTGRGVFTSVDILDAGTMIGLKTSAHPVKYPPLSKELYLSIMDIKVYESYDDDDDDNNNDNNDGNHSNDEGGAYVGGQSILMTTGIHRVVSTYAHAYGFDTEVWGRPETSVFTNILTFVNHGCNGTANMGLNSPGVNEFTIDTTDPDFQIPEDFASYMVDEYKPHLDRKFTGTMTVSEVYYTPVRAGEELFDNYLRYGGDKKFVANVNELKRDCSGALGAVEKLQLLSHKKSNPNSNNNKNNKIRDEESPDKSSGSVPPKEDNSVENDGDEEDDESFEGDSVSGDSDEL